MTSVSKRLAKTEARAVRRLGEARNRLEKFASGSKEHEHTQLLIRACEALLREIDAIWAAMPEMLDIPVRALASPQRLDLATVEAMMLWPDDPVMRHRWRRSAWIEAGVPLIDSMSIETVSGYAKELLAPERIGDLQALAGERQPYGLVAGGVLLEATVQALLAPEKASVVREVREALAKRLKGTIQIEPRTMINKNGPVYKFRPVAHLWASYLFACHFGYDKFPCSYEGLPIFLRRSETIRKAAEATKPPRASDPLMCKGEAVTLPPEVIEALGKLSFDPVPPGG